MSKFAQPNKAPNVHSPIKTTGEIDETYEGGTGHVRDAKSELFLLAVSNMVSENTFYESASDRDARFEALIHQVTKEDSDWVQRFIPWLRSEAWMRSASVVAAAEYLKAGGENARQVIAKTLQRADEPAEILAYWSQRHGKNFPMALKRGVGDAVGRLYNEYAAQKYDSQGHAWRMGDVIELVHPVPTAGWQSELFKYLLDRRHRGAEAKPGEALVKINATNALNEMPEDQRRAELEMGELIREAGWTWERLSGWLPGGMDAKAWEAVIPQMGYMALLRNLRNFDQAQISKSKIQEVCSRLSNEEEVAKSKQFPMRFINAYKAVGSEHWKPALSDAIDASLANVPVLPGKTLIMVDVSSSMSYSWSERGKSQYWETASVFGGALALRAEHADLVVFSNGHGPIPFSVGDSLFTIMKRIASSPHFGGGTETLSALVGSYAGHDRVVIATDEQAFGANPYVEGQVKAIPLIYTFNLAGYRTGALPSGELGRHTFGGLNDSAFKLLPMLEQLQHGSWPF